MTDDAEIPPDEAEDWPAFVSDQAEETLLQTEQTLAVARRLFSSLMAEYEAGNGNDPELKALALRMTGLQSALLREKNRYDIERRRITGGLPGRDIDFETVRSEIGSALDRIRFSGGPVDVSNGAEP